MTSSRRRRVLALLGCAAAAAATVPLYALAASDPGRAPDLRADPVGRIDQPAVYADTQGGVGANRLLVRFDGYVTNVGGGPLEIRGNPQIPQSDPGGVKQYALATGQAAGSVPSEAVGTPEVAFESNDTHNHFHLKRAMRYSLWNLSRTAEVAPGQKVGFCLYDLDPDLTPPAPPAAPQVYVEAVTQFCDTGDAAATALRMGVSSGWRDVYAKTLAFQWVDVSSTAPGTYLVASQADPDNAIWEGGGAGPETNPRTFATTPVTVPGHVAKAVTAAQTGGRQQITLASTAFGTPGPVRYEISTPPAHGTLDRVTGSSFNGPVVTYTPDAGYTGADTFSYIAFDSTSAFPRAGGDPQAAVSIVAATPSVAISGAPASMIAGTSAQLSAVVSGAPGGVIWSTTAGSVSPDGLFHAPATPPGGGTVTVRATSTAAPAVSAEVVITVTAVPVATPAPLPAPTAPRTTAVGTKLLSRLTTGHLGRRVVIGTVTTGPKAGRVDVIVSLKGRVLGRCGARVGAAKTVSCRIILRKDYRLSRIRFTVRLSILGRSVAVRRAYVD